MLEPLARHPEPEQESACLAQFVQLVRSNAPVSTFSRLNAEISRQLQDRRLTAPDLQRLICAICDLLHASAGNASAESEFVRLLMESCASLAGLGAQSELIESARAITRLAKRGRFCRLMRESQLLDAVEVSSLEPEKLSKLAWCLASNAGTDALLGQLAARAVEHFPGLSAFGISNIAWALAKTGGQKLNSHSLEDRNLCLHFFEVCSEARLEEFAASDLSGLSWAFATATAQPQPHFKDALFLEAAARLGEQTNKQFINLCWAAAGMRVTDNPLLYILSQHVSHRISHGYEGLGCFQGRDLAVLAWAFASMLYVQCLPEILTASAARANDFAPQNLCNLLWAVAKSKTSAGSEGPPVSAACQEVSTIIGVARTQLHRFRPHDLASFAWAMVALRACKSSVLHAARAASEAGAGIDTFMPRDLASFAWALVTLQIKRHPFLDAAVERSQHLLLEFSGRDLANLTWAFALAHTERLLDSDGHGSKQAVYASLAVRATTAPNLTAQSLSNLAWACATLSASGEDGQVCRTLWCRTMSMQNQLQLRDTASIAWAFVMLACESAHLNTLMERAGALLAAFLHSRSHESVGHDERAQDASSMLTLLWVGQFANTLGLKVSQSSELFGLARGCLQAIGRKFDQGNQCVSASPAALSPLFAPSPLCSGRNWITDAEPLILHESSSVLAVYKPHGWEVDQSGSSTGVRKLSTYLSSQVPVRRCPILKDSTHLHGFLHRLDVPSSGLILLAKTYEAFYHLMVQLHLGEIARDYIVLCHGWVAPSTHEIAARVLWSDSAGSSSPSRALSSELSGGKPSVTQTKVLAHLVLRNQQPHSLVAIRIQTGRRHQIRAHLAHIGHPVVCDPKYDRVSQNVPRSVQTTIAQGECDTPNLETGSGGGLGLDDFDCAKASGSDKVWCPRNFLHRYRLEFADACGINVVQVPLPEDLQQALQHLSARPGLHWQMSHRQLRGWQTSEALEDWAKLLPLPAHSDGMENWSWSGFICLVFNQKTIPLLTPQIPNPPICSESLKAFRAVGL